MKSNRVAEKQLSMKRGAQEKRALFDDLCIIGRPSDVATVRVMYACLRDDVIKLRDAKRGHSAAYKSAYVVGVVDGISDAIAMNKKAAEDRARATAGSGNALVLVNQAIANVQKRTEDAHRWAYQNMNFRAGRASNYGSGDSGAREQGRQDGRRINIGARGQIGQPRKGMIR
jgi:hypothetical protein